MKNLIGCALILLVMGSCSNDDDNRTSGVCYCEFANGERQEYDLTDLPRDEQIEACETHSNNAAHFGGVCRLE